MVWMEGVRFKDYPGILLDKQRQPPKASIRIPSFSGEIWTQNCQIWSSWSVENEKDKDETLLGGQCLQGYDIVVFRKVEFIFILCHC